MPRVLNSRDLYAADRPGLLSRVVRGFRSLVYVPNSRSSSVDEIDPTTGLIVRHFPVGRNPQHVTPSYDLKTLWVLNDQGNSVTKVDPRTGDPGATIAVDDPYNMYYTPDGRYAVVVAEKRQRLDFRDPQTMALRSSLRVPCPGVDHADFSADGRFALFSCEFGAAVVKIDVAARKVVARLALQSGSSPQDVKVSPDGRVFYVADQAHDGLWEIDGTRLRVLGFLPTGRGVHGLYVSRDSRLLYAGNRRAGTVSVISFATRHITATWTIPGGSPDMGGVSADGRVLWLTGRYNAEVYAIDTRSGRLLKRIRVGSEPHGLCVFPQPGRYSLGHTGVFR
jgi:DNA-binding beta-propeller fold protein YncE